MGVFWPGCFLVVVGILASRFEGYSKELRRSPKFWIFTIIFLLIGMLGYLLPAWEKKNDDEKVAKEISASIANEISNNIRIIEKWKVLIDKKFPGVEVLSISLGRIEILKKIDDEKFSVGLKFIYEDSERINKRLDKFRYPAEGYSNKENAKRIQDDLSGLLDKMRMALEVFKQKGIAVSPIVMKEKSAEETFRLYSDDFESKKISDENKSPSSDAMPSKSNETQ